MNAKVLKLTVTLFGFSLPSGCNADKSIGTSQMKEPLAPLEIAKFADELAEFVAKVDKTEAGELTKRKSKYDHERDIYSLEDKWEIDPKHRKVTWIRLRDVQNRPSLVDIAEYHQNADGEFVFKWTAQNLTFKRQQLRNGKRVDDQERGNQRGRNSIWFLQ